MKRIYCWSLVTAMALSTGCSTFNQDWKKKLPWWPESRIKTSKYETPSQMIAIWSPDLLTQQNIPPTRGFGGRLYFYNDKNQAVPVEGQLVVYAYDETKDPHEPGKPQRKFAFTPDQFTNHFSHSDLGASYSIWLPWDASGGEQSSITLVPVFTATSGKVLMGQQAVNVLPGRVATKPVAEQPKSLLTERSTAGVQQATHEQAPNRNNQSTVGADSTSPPAPQRMRTSTINLTPSLQRRVVQSGMPSPGIPQAAEASATVPMARESVPDVPAPGPLSARFVQQKHPVRGALTAPSSPTAPWTPPYPARLPSAPPPASTLPAPATPAASQPAG